MYVYFDNFMFYDIAFELFYQLNLVHRRTRGRTRGCSQPPPPRNSFFRRAVCNKKTSGGKIIFQFNPKYIHSHHVR